MAKLSKYKIADNICTVLVIFIAIVALFVAFELPVPTSFHRILLSHMITTLCGFIIGILVTVLVYRFMRWNNKKWYKS